MCVETINALLGCNPEPRSSIHASFDAWLPALYDSSTVANVSPPANVKDIVRLPPSTKTYCNVVLTKTGPMASICEVNDCNRSEVFHNDPPTIGPVGPFTDIPLKGAGIAPSMVPPGSAAATTTRTDGFDRTYVLPSCFTAADGALWVPRWVVFVQDTE